LVEPLKYDDVRKVNISIYKECDPRGSLGPLARLGATRSVKRVVQVKAHFWYLSLWPDIKQRYTHDEENCINLAVSEIEDFERSKKSRVSNELSWEKVKSKKGNTIDAYFKKETKGADKAGMKASHTACQVMLTTTVRATSVEIAR
jgi:hypothetical protein